jgi:hypothetical protein
MNPELIERLEKLAQHHEHESTRWPTYASSFHTGAAADIRAAIVSADDATKNMLILRAHKAKDRRFSGESITGFDELQEGSS